MLFDVPRGGKTRHLMLKPAVRFDLVTLRVPTKQVCRVREADVCRSAGRSTYARRPPHSSRARSGICAARDWVAGRKPNEIPRDNSARPESIPPFELKGIS